ncbi:hypothetical protein GE09DRAFT_1282841 [Coniochaeta sp. 2T2.1]|nr:hypothetical protein GE09DRAFT_1282841 [Coniochaeta sp. 2T2.1]
MDSAELKHLKDSMVVTEFYSRTLPVEHGHNLFKLSEALAKNGEANAAEADALRDRAETICGGRSRMWLKQ